MSDYRNILVAVDYSPHSKNAMVEASRLADKSGARLHVGYVLSEITFEDFASCFTLSEAESIANAMEPMEAFVSENLFGITNVAKHVRIGDALEVILDLIQETKAEVLVLGTRGHSKGEHQLGTLAAKLVRHSPVPVLLVRGAQRRPFQKVVACVDFSDTSKLALRESARIAQQDSAELEILHVYCPPWLKPSHVMYNLKTWPDGDAKAQFFEILQEQLDVFAEDLKKSYPGLVFTASLVEHENESYGLLHHLRDVGADLAVIGSHGHSRFRELLLGSTAERLIHGTDCSILVVKPEHADEKKA